MPTMLEKAFDKLNLDKSDWQLVRFGDVAIQQKKTLDREITELTRYVKGEHMYSEDLHLREWGELKDEYLGPAFIRKFEQGDILYGSRRTYLRKVVIAPFEGITSNTTFVIKANEKLMDKRLLPFLMLSEGFAQHSIRNSKGSVNPYINWKDLTEYEFLLPPKCKQEEISSLLCTLDYSLDIDESLMENLKVTFHSMISKCVPKESIEKWSLGKIVKIKKGLTYKSSDYSDEANGLPLLNLKSIERGGGFNRLGIKYYLGQYKEENFVKDENLYIACTDLTRDGAVVGYPLKPETYKSKKMLYTMDLASLEIIDKNLLQYYLYYVLRSPWVHWFLFSHSPGTTVLHLDTVGLKKLKIPKLSLDDQILHVSRLQKIEASIENISKKLTKSKQLKKSIINQIF
jgi:type I restriction enzyme S subunit